MMKDYKNMTQEELEKELAEIVKKNYEKGVVLLDRDYDICTLRLKKLSDIENIEDIDAIIAIIHNMKYKPDLKSYCKGMNDKSPLIHPITGKYAWKEQTYDDFVSREEFINRTGIFVTPSQFSYIHDVDWKEAKESGTSLDDFINDYEDNCGEVMEVPLHGTFKYIVSDDYLSCIGEYNEDDGCGACYLSSVDEPNIWEIINCLARSHAQEYESKWEMIEKYKAMLTEAMNNLEQYKMLLSVPTMGTPS